MGALIWLALAGVAVQGLVTYTAVRAAILHALPIYAAERDALAKADAKADELQRRAEAEQDQVLE